MTARDHQDLGSCLSALGSIGRLNHFHDQNPEADARRDDQDNPNISWPNYHSGANGDYQPVFGDRTGARAAADDEDAQWSHRMVPRAPARRCGLRTARRSDGARRSHAAAASSPVGTSTSRSASTARRATDGRAMGRVGGLLDVPPLRRHELGHRRRRAVVRHRQTRRRDRSATRHASTVFKDYVHNIARWLARETDPAGTTPR